MNKAICCFVAANLLLASTYSPFIAEMSFVHMASAALTVSAVLLGVLNIIISKRLKYTELLLLLIIAAYIIIAAVYFLAGIGVNELARSYLPFFYLPAYALLCLRLDAPSVLFLLRCIVFIGGGVCFLVFPFFIELLVFKSLNFNRFTAYSDLSHTPILIIMIPLVYLLMPKYKYILLLPIFITLLATQSKGLILFGILALCLSETTKKKISVRTLVRISLLILLLSTPFFLFQDTLTERFSNVTGSTNMHRIEEMKVASEYIEKNPILGGGPSIEFSIDSPTAKGHSDQRYIHNVIFYILATGGVFGLLLYLLPFFHVYMRRGNNTSSNLIYIAIFSSFLYFMVSATFKSIHTNMYLGVLIGALLVCAETMKKES